MPGTGLFVGLMPGASAVSGVGLLGIIPNYQQIERSRSENSDSMKMSPMQGESNVLRLS